MNINYYDLFYTVSKNRKDKEIVNNENETIENGYNNFNDFITPHQYFGTKYDKVMLR